MAENEANNAPITPRKLLVIIVEVILIILIAMVAVGCVQMYWIAPIAVDGTSMEDTLHDKDKVYINKAYKTLARGDVVVTYVPSQYGRFDISGYSEDWWEYTGENEDSQRCPASRKKTFDDFLHFLPFVSGNSASDNPQSEDGYYLIIKRIVGIPNDTIEIDHGVLYVNGERESRAALATYDRDYPPHVLGEGEYFVLGDNRSVSHDSHFYGPIRANWIYGKVTWAFVSGKLKTVI